MSQAKNAYSTQEPTSRRRTLFAAASAVVIGTGITSGVAASVADYAEAPDAELIRLCVEFDVLERRRQDACNSATTMQEDEAADRVWAKVREQQEPILARICATPAITLEGVGAVAASLVLWDGELFIECDEPNACTNERLKLALLRSVMARKA